MEYIYSELVYCSVSIDITRYHSASIGTTLYVTMCHSVLLGINRYYSATLDATIYL